MNGVLIWWELDLFPDPNNDDDDHDPNDNDKEIMNNIVSKKKKTTTTKTGTNATSGKASYSTYYDSNQPYQDHWHTCLHLLPPTLQHSIVLPDSRSNSSRSSSSNSSSAGGVHVGVGDSSCHEPDQYQKRDYESIEEQINHRDFFSITIQHDDTQIYVTDLQRIKAPPPTRTKTPNPTDHHDFDSQYQSKRTKVECHPNNVDINQSQVEKIGRAHV